MKLLINFLLCSFLIFCSFDCYSQQSQAVKIDIQYLSLKDTVVLKNISFLANYMDTSNVKHNLKKNFGYIELHVGQFSQGDTLVSYYFTPQYTPIDKEKKDKAFPDFYSFVNNRLIIIYIDVMNAVADKTFSTKTKRKLITLMDKCFEKPHKTTFYNMDGSVAFADNHFRLSWFPLGAGQYIYILKNKPAIVLKEK